MRKILILLFVFLFSMCAFAQDSTKLKTGIEANDYTDYLETVNLTPKQRRQILRIRNEENYVLATAGA